MMILADLLCTVQVGEIDQIDPINSRPQAASPLNCDDSIIDRFVWAILVRTTCPTAQAGQLLVTDLPQVQILRVEF